MRHRSTHRSAAACAGFTLMLLPAVATTAGGTATLDPVVPRARAAAAVAEADLDWSLASRSGTRTVESASAARPVRARTGGAGVTAGDVRVSGPKGTRVWTASAMASSGESCLRTASATWIAAHSASSFCGYLPKSWS